MQALRILSGTHAGAQVRLKRHRYRLGRGEDVDIQLTDWSREPLDLVIKSCKAAMLLAVPDSGEHGPIVRPLARLKDFMPVRMGDITFCLGPADKAWPTDADLLSRLPVEAANSASINAALPASRAGWWAAAVPARRRTGCLVAGTLLVAGVGLAGVSSAVPEVRSTVVLPSNLAERVAQRLHEAGVQGARVRSNGRAGVVVEGLLGDMHAVAQARGALAGLEAPAGQSVRLQLAAASELSQSLTDALNDPRLSASYRGQGQFVITGSARDIDSLRQTAQRLAADLAPLVRGIELQVTETRVVSNGDGNAMLADKDVQYVQLKNGTRYLSGNGIEPLSRKP